MSAFQSGSIYWSPQTGANEVQGLIRGRYLTLGGATGTLGLPVSDEQAAPGGGRQSVFQNGILRWNPATGMVTRVGQ